MRGGNIHGDPGRQTIMRLQMTTDEQIEILGKGERAWNRRRQEYPDEATPDLSGSQFAHANFSGFDLHGVVLQKAYLRGASLRGTCLRQADLQGAYLIDADLDQADLSQARLLAANLNGANLTDCAFQGADLREADCGGADLSRADFTDANLQCANLLGANLEGARFVRTKGLSSRQLMAGRNWEKAQFHPDLADRLDLPFARATGRPVLAEGHAAVENNQPASSSEESNPAFATLSCSLDPSLG